jgi:hypothetical protein
MRRRSQASAFDKLDAKISPAPAVLAPRVTSLRHFLETEARVPVMGGAGAGSYVPYSFAGRESLIEVVNLLDHVLGSSTGKPLKDSSVALAGGAQFGKTTLENNVAAYCAACLFLNPIVYLPDDKLADTIVDAKFRPDVLDQIPWIAEMTKVGRSVNESGKAVNTKGAFLVTDGKRKAVGMFRGLQKPPTTFSADVVIEDEKDDIPAANAKFLSGRMTNSTLRLRLIFGTQRIHGAGQNKVWKNGSQGVVLLATARTWAEGVDQSYFKSEHGHTHVTAVPPGFINPEESFPQVVRCAITGTPRTDDPVLGYEGDFRRPGSTEALATHTPDGVYYYAHPVTGEPLKTSRPVWHHRRPERLAMRDYTFRVAQIGTAAIDLAQIVAHWTKAIADADEMVAFRCDRQAMPKSAAQALTPDILERSRTLGGFYFGEKRSGVTRFAGLDTGDRCWYVCREIASPADKRLVNAVQIPSGDVVARAIALATADEVSTLFIDERPAVNEARTIALALNGLADFGDTQSCWPVIDFRSRETYLALPGGLTWDGRNQKWLGLRCAVVRFTKQQLGAGIDQGGVEFEEGGIKKFVPMIACNRFETIDRAVREFLTLTEGQIDVVVLPDGKKAVRTEPAMRLPRRTPGAPGILETLDGHLLAGSQRAKDGKTGELGDYLDGIENHLLLADGYSALAETIGGTAKAAKFAFQSVDRTTAQHDEGFANPREVLL